MTDSAGGSPHAFARLALLPVTPLAIAISCLFSLIVIASNPLLNNDAYSYLRAADMFNERGALAVLQSFSWHSYAILIALLDRVVPGGMVAAAHVFNTACYALLTWAFILLSRELRATPRVQWFAAGCILLLPLLNEMRFFLIRDIAFCAFALLSVTGLIRFIARGAARYALWWCAALLAAALFRLEALLLLALTPFAVLLPDGTHSVAERARHVALLAGTALLLLAALLAAGAAAGADYVQLAGYAYRWYLPPLGQLLTGAPLDTVTVQGIDTSAHDAIDLLDNVVNALSEPVTLFLLAFVLKRGLPVVSLPATRALQLYTAATLLTLLTFLAIMHFLTQRYAALLSILLLSLVPPMLDDLYVAARERGLMARFRAVLGFAVLYYCVDSLVSFGASQDHTDQAIAWIRNELPAGAALKTNSFPIAYHSGRVPEYDAIQRDPAVVVQDSASGDYLALDVDRDDDTAFLDTDPQLLSIARFVNERGDAVHIYRRQ